METMENYIIRKLENTELENRQLKQDLKNLHKAIKVFKEHFIIKRYDGAINLEITINDKNNDYIAFAFNEKAESLIELLSLLDHKYTYDD